MNVDRYITDDAVAAVWSAMDHEDYEPGWPPAILRAVLPNVLARHRADVLREVFSGDPFMESALVRRGIREEAWAADDVTHPEVAE